MASNSGIDRDHISHMQPFHNLLLTSEQEEYPFSLFDKAHTE